MNIINESTHSLFTISGNLQEIKTILNDAEVPVQSKVESIETLDEIFTFIEILKEEAKNTDNFAQGEFAALDKLEEEAIELYGIAHNYIFDYKVSIIVQGAKELSSTLESRDVEKIAMKVDALKKFIFTFKENFRPSIKHRQIVDLAEQLVNRAGEIVEGKKVYGPEEHQKFLIFLELMIRTSDDHETIFIDPEEYGLIMELFEVAELFYKGKKNEGKSRLLQMIDLLPQEKKEKILTIENPEILALLVLEMAQELADKKMPSADLEEIEEWFTDSEEENKSGFSRIVPLYV